MPEMPDFDEIMKMAQNAQAELQKAQDNLDTIEVEGVAGGGMVKIRATAKGRILGVLLNRADPRRDGYYYYYQTYQRYYGSDDGSAKR